MKIIVNNASMTFVKGTSNSLSNVNWTTGYWGKTEGTTQKFTANDGYTACAELVPVPTGVSKVTFSWNVPDAKKDTATLIIGETNEEGKIVAVTNITSDGGTIELNSETKSLGIHTTNSYLLSADRGENAGNSIKAVFE